jgi:PIN domain nuclease of toxin-antitoxin system
MNAILDTHILLWWLDNPTLIKDNARSVISERSNNIFISSITIWEIVIKKSLGKLKIPNNLAEVIKNNRFLYLPIKPEHAFALEDLPDYHRDPFDRMLIVQSICERFTLITRDKQILHYQINSLVG